MKIKISEIVDAQAVADAAGVSRRTITRSAAKAGALVTLAGKGYLRRKKLLAVVGADRWTPSVQKLCSNGPSGDSVDPSAVMSRASVAAEVGCDPATVWRVSRRFLLGVECYGDLLFTRKMIPDIAARVGQMSASPEEISEMRKRAVNARWSQWRAERSGKSGKAAAGSRSRRSPAVSR